MGVIGGATPEHGSRRPREAALLWRVNPGAGRAYIIVTTACFVEGLALVGAPDKRMAGEAYRTINELGGPAWFGVTMLVIAAFLAFAPFGRLGLVRSALLAGCSIHMAIAISFVSSTLRSSTAGPLAPIIMSTIALWFISQSDLYRTRRR